MTTGVERPLLTPRQAEILSFIRDHIRSRGYPPTLRRIGDEFGIRSPNGVVCHIRSLIRKGYVAHDPLVSRGLRLIDGPDVPETHAEKVARLKREASKAVARYKAALAEGES